MLDICVFCHFKDTDRRALLHDTTYHEAHAQLTGFHLPSAGHGGPGATPTRPLTTSCSRSLLGDLGSNCEGGVMR
ncbi:hypothetical protein CgunFtcFv8_006810 [Champsocephalus gunnari]|uniref:Uncharacterized protein n=1 Tax=Champsocephalus gunnari TaxID=52237 RepID=A0AAN8H5M1_CHAGU|nr:hypothetical protein CgunFtcFv8_006810 [Champsocephalus gunnari]